MNNPIDIFDLQNEIKNELVDETEANQQQTDAMARLDQQRADEAANDVANFFSNMRSGISHSYQEDAPTADTDRLKAEVYHLEKCQHEVFWPIHMHYSGLSEYSGSAKEFPFKLDEFQVQAIRCVESKESVIVSAHTSAGKTVIALYAIAQCLNNNRKVIYTSPIKALSNQKYRELEQEFNGVGLITGDITKNPKAPCVVMTTEILRSMLYKNEEDLRKVEYVIFDEVHYMQDEERGVVWEETIALLPQNVKCIFLSATIANGREFARWIANSRLFPCHVISTQQRPVPLSHVIYPTKCDSMFEVVNPLGKFNHEMFQKIADFMTNSKEQLKKLQTHYNRINGFEVRNIIRTLMERNCLPCIVFSFNKRECEKFATDVKDMDFTTSEEKEMIGELYSSALLPLAEDERKLPNINNILTLLKRGIAVHHAGLLPFVRELVEILFGEGLIKVLFATETFAMGINMPAKSVFFTSCRKFDGNENRWLSCMEYTQMSGRAGRRGIDQKGIAIMTINNPNELQIATIQKLLQGESEALESKFRLTYNMILNSKRYGYNVEEIVAKSFLEFQNIRKTNELQAKEQELMVKLGNNLGPRDLDLTKLAKMEKELKEKEDYIAEYIQKPAYVVPFLKAGRLIHVVDGDRDFGWAPIINYEATPASQNGNDEKIYIVSVLIHVHESCKGSNLPPRAILPDPPQPNDDAAIQKLGRWEVIPIRLDCIREVSSIRMKLVENLNNKEHRDACGHAIQKIINQCQNGMEVLDPVKDMRIPDEKLKEAVKRKKELVEQIENAAVRKLKDYDSLRKNFDRRMQTQQEFDNVLYQRKQAMGDFNKEEMKNRLDVLFELQYIDDQQNLTLKGIIASEITTVDELMLTEILFSEEFDELSAAQIVTLISCLVFQESAPIPRLTSGIKNCFRLIQSCASSLAKYMNKNNIKIDPRKYIDSFNPGAMPAVYDWANEKKPLYVILKQNPEIFEGSLVRCLRRIDEVLRELSEGLKQDTDRGKLQKIENARDIIQRDVVITSSLYL